MTAKLDLKNKLINGCFDYWQRGTSFAATGGTQYTADRWRLDRNMTTSAAPVSKSSDVPSSAFGTSSLVIDCTTAQASLGPNEFLEVFQTVEGNVLRTFKNKKMVLSFWVKSTKTGIFSVSLRGPSRSLVKEYTVLQSDTWEKKTIRFTHDSSGTWNYDTSIGLYVSFPLCAGISYKTSPDTWQNGVFVCSVNQVNALDSTSNHFKLTDIVLVEDNDGQTRSPDFLYAGRDYMEEFQLCQRYYEKSGNQADLPGANVGQGRVHTPTSDTSTGVYVGHTTQFKVSKRTAPTVTIYDFNSTPNKFSSLTGGGLVNAQNGISPQQIGVGESSFYFIGLPGAANFGVFTWSADAEL